ncbi:MAG: hypothetical protein LBC71_01130 [Oscillospiraceae bacterium]|nr:hypothetical protein [Oscillospiraceae bacterium]
MKKRLLPIVLAMILIMMMMPFGPSASAAAGNAWIGGTFQNDDGDIDWVEYKDQSVEFNLNELFTVTADFGDEVNKHDDAGWGYIAVVQTDLEGDPSLAVYIQSIVVDGNEIEFDASAAIAWDEGGIRIPLTHVWRQDAGDPVVLDGPEAIGEFSKLEVTLALIEEELLSGEAWIAGTFAEDEDSLDWFEFKDQAVAFKVGEEFTVTVDVGDDVWIHGDAGWGYLAVINTDLSDILADFLSVEIDKIIVDGEEIDFDADAMALWGEGGIRVGLTHVWREDGGDPIPLKGPETIGEFSKLEVVLTISIGGFVASDGDDNGDDVVLPMSGKAYIGGVFVFLDRPHPGNEESPDISDWWAFEDQAVSFDVGVPFTVGIDMGSEKIRHDLAHWDGESYIVAIDTDLAASPIYYEAHIYWITKDGASVSFDDEAVTVGQERGNLRVSLTNSWAQNDGNPVPIDGPQRLGEFSKLEVRMVFIESGAAVPSDNVEPDVTPPDPGNGDKDPDDNGKDTEKEKDGDFPKWLVPVIIAGAVVIIGAVVVVIIIKKKKA